MLHTKLIFACVLHILHGYNNACPNDLYAHQVADNISIYSDQENVSSDIIAATIWSESHYSQYAKSERNAIGLMQIKRKGAIQGADLKLSFHELADIRTNIRIGVHYMASLNIKCPGKTTYLTIYNTGHGKCRSSSYSRGVSADLKKGLKWEKDLLMPPIKVGEFVISGD